MIDYSGIKDRTFESLKNYYKDRGLQKNFGISDENMAYKRFGENTGVDPYSLNEDQKNTAISNFKTENAELYAGSNLYNQFLFANNLVDEETANIVEDIEEESKTFFQKTLGGIGDELLELVPGLHLLANEKKALNDIQTAIQTAKESGAGFLDILNVATEIVIGYQSNAMLTVNNYGDNVIKGLERGAVRVLDMVGSSLVELNDQRFDSQNIRENIINNSEYSELFTEINELRNITNKTDEQNARLKELENTTINVQNTSGFMSFLSGVGEKALELTTGEDLSEYSNMQNVKAKNILNKYNSFSTAGPFAASVQGLSVIGETLRGISNAMIKTEAMNNEYSKAIANGEIEMKGQWKDPRFWTNQIPESVGQIAGIVGLTALTPGVPDEFAAAGYVIDGLPINVMFSAVESNQVREDAKAAGYSDSEIAAMTDKTFILNVAVQGALGAAPGAVSKLAAKSSKFAAFAATSTSKRYLALASTTTIDALFEGTEEILQDEIRNAQLDGDYKFMAESSFETFLLGFAGGLFGGGTVFMNSNAMDRTYNNFLNNPSVSPILVSKYQESRSSGKTDIEAKDAAITYVMELSQGTPLSEELEETERKDMLGATIEEIVKPAKAIQSQAKTIIETRDSKVNLEKRKTQIDGTNFKFDENNGNIRIIEGIDEQSKYTDKYALTNMVMQDTYKKYGIVYDKKTNTYTKEGSMTKFAKDVEMQLETYEQAHKMIVDLSSKVKVSDTKKYMTKHGITNQKINNMYDNGALTDSQYVKAVRELGVKPAEAQLAKNIKLADDIEDGVKNLENLDAKSYKKIMDQLIENFGTAGKGINALVKLGALDTSDATAFKGHLNTLRQQAKDNTKKELDKVTKERDNIVEETAKKDVKQKETTKKLRDENKELKKQVKKESLPQKVVKKSELKADTTIGLNAEQTKIDTIRNIEKVKKTESDLMNEKVAQMQEKIRMEELAALEAKKDEEKAFLKAHPKEVNFHNSLLKARKNHKYKLSVDNIAAKDLVGTTMILKDNDTAGAVVLDDGNIRGVFKDPSNKSKTIVDEVMNEAIAVGGVKLDAYNINGFLPKLYSKYGFIVTGKLAFNEEYADKAWDKSVYGEPDLVAMVHESVIADKNIEVKTFTDYEEMLDHRDSLINKEIEKEVKPEVKSEAKPKQKSALPIATTNFMDKYNAHVFSDTNLPVAYYSDGVRTTAFSSIGYNGKNIIFQLNFNGKWVPTLGLNPQMDGKILTMTSNDAANYYHNAELKKIGQQLDKEYGDIRKDIEKYKSENNMDFITPLPSDINSIMENYNESSDRKFDKEVRLKNEVVLKDFINELKQKTKVEKTNVVPTVTVGRKAKPQKHASNVSTNLIAKIMDVDRAEEYANRNDKYGKKHIIELAEQIAKDGFKDRLHIDYNPETGETVLGEGNHRLQIALQLGLVDMPADIVIGRGVNIAKESLKLPTGLIKSGVVYEGPEFDAFIKALEMTTNNTILRPNTKAEVKLKYDKKIENVIDDYYSEATRFLDDSIEMAKWKKRRDDKSFRTDYSNFDMYVEETRHVVYEKKYEVRTDDKGQYWLHDDNDTVWEVKKNKDGELSYLTIFGEESKADKEPHVYAKKLMEKYSDELIDDETFQENAMDNIITDSLLGEEETDYYGDQIKEFNKMKDNLDYTEDSIVETMDKYNQWYKEEYGTEYNDSKVKGFKEQISKIKKEAEKEMSFVKEDKDAYNKLLEDIRQFRVENKPTVKKKVRKNPVKVVYERNKINPKNVMVGLETETYGEIFDGAVHLYQDASEQTKTINAKERFMYDLSKAKMIEVKTQAEFDTLQEIYNMKDSITSKSYDDAAYLFANYSSNKIYKNYDLIKQIHDDLVKNSVSSIMELYDAGLDLDSWGEEGRKYIDKLRKDYDASDEDLEFDNVGLFDFIADVEKVIELGNEFGFDRDTTIDAIKKDKNIFIKQGFDGIDTRAIGDYDKAPSILFDEKYNKGVSFNEVIKEINLQKAADKKTEDIIRENCK